MNKFDPRIDALVMETRTNWDSSVGTLSDEDRRWVSKSIHEQPRLASQVAYDAATLAFHARSLSLWKTFSDCICHDSQMLGHLQDRRLDILVRQKNAERCSSDPRLEIRLRNKHREVFRVAFRYPKTAITLLSRTKGRLLLSLNAKAIGRTCFIAGWVLETLPASKVC